MKKYLNDRDKLYYKKKKLNKDEEKNIVYKEIIAVTDQIRATRKEIRFCNEIEKSVPIMKKEIKALEEREKILQTNNKNIVQKRF